MPSNKLQFSKLRPQLSFTQGAEKRSLLCPQWPPSSGRSDNLVLCGHSLIILSWHAQFHGLQTSCSFLRTRKTGPKEKKGCGWEVASPEPSPDLTLPMGRMGFLFCFVSSCHSLLISCMSPQRVSGYCTLGRLLHPTLPTAAHSQWERGRKWHTEADSLADVALMFFQDVVSFQDSKEAREKDQRYSGLSTVWNKSQGPRLCLLVFFWMFCTLMGMLCICTVF